MHDINRAFFNIGNEPTAIEINAKAKALKAEGYPVISLAVGEPDFPTPSKIKEALYRAVEENRTFYPNPQGVPELRETVAAYESNRKGVEITPGNVLITVGGKPIIPYTMYLLTNPGDEVILLEPYYLAYPYWVKVFNLKLKVVRLNDDGTIPFDDLKSHITDRTKLLIINYPSNPAGTMLTREDMSRLLLLLDEFPGLYILSDEVYSRIIYEGEHISPLPHNPDRIILLESFSKTFSMTGWRLGYGIYPEWMLKYLVKYNSNLLTGPATFVQYAGITALTDPDVQRDVENMVREFRRRRDYVGERLQKMGFKFHKPSGAFYYFIDVGMDGMEFSKRLLEEKFVAVTPGIIFGPSFGNYIRISFANSMENLEEAMNRLEEFIG